MVSVIANTLLLGLGIALNPVAVVASLLILREPRSQRGGAAFVVGWILGLILLVALSSWIAYDQVTEHRAASRAWLPIIWIGIGVLLIVLSVRALWSRPSDAELPESQRWMRLVDQEGPFRIFGVGLFLATISLRNLALLAAAATILGQANLGPLEVVVAAAIFVAISSIGVLVPFLVRAFGGAGADAKLDLWSAWLVLHMATITSVVMILLGLYLLARGIADLR